MGCIVQKVVDDHIQNMNFYTNHKKYNYHYNGLNQQMNMNF